MIAARLAALPRPLVGGLLAALAGIAIVGVQHGLADLSSIRAARDTLERRLARPRPAMADGTNRRATTSLGAALRRLAMEHGVLIERLEPDPSSPAGALDLAVSGSERAVLGFAAGIGAVTPAVGLVEWRVQAVPSPQPFVRLTARATTVAGAATRQQRPGPADIARRLFVDSAEAAPSADAETNAQPTLVGIVGRLPRDAIALVQAADGETRSLAIGDSVDGWRLASLAADAAFFVRGGAHIRIDLPPA